MLALVCIKKLVQSRPLEYQATFSIETAREYKDIS